MQLYANLHIFTSNLHIMKVTYFMKEYSCDLQMGETDFNAFKKLNRSYKVIIRAVGDFQKVKVKHLKFVSCGKETKVD